MDDVLTLAEIESKYHAEWVLVADPEIDDQLGIVRGRVVFHSPDRDAVDREAIARGLEHSAVLYAGEFPDDAVIVL